MLLLRNLVKSSVIIGIVSCNSSRQALMIFNWKAVEYRHNWGSHRDPFFTQPLRQAEGYVLDWVDPERRLRPCAKEHDALAAEERRVISGLDFGKELLHDPSRYFDEGGMINNFGNRGLVETYPAEFLYQTLDIATPVVAWPDLCGTKIPPRRWSSRR